MPVGDKQGLVRGVFDSVADNYDVMNDVMSVGLHRLWKNRMIDALHLPKQSNRACRMVDIAGGTGDIAFRACDRAARLGLTLNVQVIDANAEMLRVGRDPRASNRPDKNLTLLSAMPKACRLMMPVSIFTQLLLVFAMSPIATARWLRRAPRAAPWRAVCLP